MKSQISGVALLGVALLAGQARASIVTINFDEQPAGPNVGLNVTVITTQYAGVTFSSTNGDVILIDTQAQYNTGNLICTGTGRGSAASPTYAGLDCTQDVILSFTTPIDDLSFDAFGNQDAVGSTFAVADVYLNGSATPSTSVALKVVNGGNAADHQDLNFTGITKLDIHGSNDPNGTAYDNFSFDPPGTVPEPSTLLLTGLCGIVWAGRRFLARKNL